MTNPDITTVLLVDDEPAMLAALRRVLSTTSCRCITAGSGREALAVLASQPVHVIVSDIDMPEMDGLELLRRARSIAPRATRIVITGRHSTETAIRAINEGEVHRFLLKPFDSALLRRLVGEAVERYEALGQAEETAEHERTRRSRRRALERLHPGIFDISRSASGAYLLDARRAIDFATQTGLDFLLESDD